MRRWRCCARWAARGWRSTPASGRSGRISCCRAAPSSPRSSRLWPAPQVMVADRGLREGMLLRMMRAEARRRRPVAQLAAAPARRCCSRMAGWRPEEAAGLARRLAGAGARGLRCSRQATGGAQHALSSAGWAGS